MLLKKIIIQNYKSIEHLELDINEISGCKLHTFFGINEAGKSSILKAISLLSENNTVQYDEDCNLNAQDYGHSIILRYIFEVTKEDNLTAKLKKLNVPFVLPIEAMSAYGPLHVEKTIQINDKSQREEFYKILDTEVSPAFLGTSDDGPLVIIGKVAVATGELLAKTNIGKSINSEAKPLFDGLIPEVIFWKASEEYLITKPINLENFKQNHNISIPLKHIFELCGYDDNQITINVERIQQKSNVRMKFEQKLSRTITNHINRIWSEHEINIGVRLENNNLCEIYVEDKGNTDQRFNMKQRSDGFKQFISILLSLSVKNDTNQLKNKIILLDEPEASLHPGSIRCLRDELLRISKNNIVLASSHSIFMVDKQNLNRHYTVTKEDSQTLVEQVNPNNPIQDEVIYNALGTSIYEIIRPNMLIFEGRTDKDIFDNFTKKYGQELEPIDIQTISATGTKQIPKYVKFFHSSFVKGFVVVDSDQDGKAALKEILKQDEEFENNIFELKQLVDIPLKIVTLEDLLPEQIALSCANKLHGINFAPSDGRPILDVIKSTKKENNVHDDGKLEELKRLITHKVLDDIQNKTTKELRLEYPYYVEFLTSLHKRMKGVA